MQSDFSQGKVWKNVINQAIPLMVAQLIQILYNVVDRIYIGHLPVIGSNALTGIGLVFPITTLVAAFTNLFSTGGVPLFSMARGAKEEKKAELILGQVVSLLFVTSLALMALCYIFKRPVLFLFGASEETYVYADQYLKIYLLGTIFSVLSTGLNGFINAQGYPKKGMMTVMLGAIINLILDPVFIYGLHMGVYGAAIATVISQGVSFMWALSFFMGKKNQNNSNSSRGSGVYSLVKLSAYIVLLLSALLTLFQLVLKWFGVNFNVGIFATIREVCMILVICIASYGFTLGKGKTWKILFWAAVLILLAAYILFKVKGF